MAKNKLVSVKGKFDTVEASLSHWEGRPLLTLNFKKNYVADSYWIDFKKGKIVLEKWTCTCPTHKSKNI